MLTNSFYLKAALSSTLTLPSIQYNDPDFPQVAQGLISSYNKSKLLNIV